MRLICGVLRLDGEKADDDLLRAMAAQMDVPRLRPALRLWRDGPVALAVLDFSARGVQALALPETAGLIMAADVRLDEPAALAQGLGSDAPQAEDALLLAILARSGPSGLSQVLGDFAFASWNRNAQHLVCGRDVFGIRPFAYVHQPGKLFAFASFPKALHGAGVVAKKVDEDAMLRRMVGNLRCDDSLIAGIKRLPPAHIVDVSQRRHLADALLATRSCPGWDKKVFTRRRRTRITPAGGRGRQMPPAAQRGGRRAFEWRS